MRNSDYAGVGTVGHLNSRFSDQDAESLQSVVQPTYSSRRDSTRQYGSSRYSSTADRDVEDVQEIVAPNLQESRSRTSYSNNNQEEDLSNIHSAAYRRAQISDQSEDDLQKTVTSGYQFQPVYGGSRVYSSRSQQKESESSRTVAGSAPVYGQNQGALSRNFLSTSRTDADENDEQVRVQPGNRIAVTVRPGQPIKIMYSPNQGYQVGSSSSSSSSAVESSSQSSQSYPTSQTYRVVYTPVYTPSRNTQTADSDRTSTRINGIQRPEKLTNYDKFNTHSSSQSRFQNEEVEDTQQRVAPVSVSQPSNGGTSRYSSQSQSQSQNSGSRYVQRPVSSTISNSRVSDSGNYLNYSSS